MKTGILSILSGTLLLTSSYVPTVFSADKDEMYPGNKDRHLREAAKYRFEFNNDLFFNSDNLFTNGWAFQVHTPVVDSWANIEGSVEWIKTFGAMIPTLTAEDLNYRTSFAVGQIMSTPDEIENPNLITDDIPYSGVLTLKTSWIAYNDVDFRGFELVLGVTGRPAMAEQMQNLVHNISDSEIAEGWDNQLKTEPVINFNYMRKNKFYQSGDAANFSFDAAISGDVQLGTLFSATGIRLETRFGNNMPRGFSYRPDPIGRFLTYDATLAPPKPKEASIYGTFSVGASYFAHNLILDGNVFAETVHSVEKEDVVGLVTVGFHYERPSWGVHLDFNLSSDIIDTDEIAGNPDPENKYGTLMVEWRI